MSKSLGTRLMSKGRRRDPMGVVGDSVVQGWTVTRKKELPPVLFDSISVFFFLLGFFRYDLKESFYDL